MWILLSFLWMFSNMRDEVMTSYCSKKKSKRLHTIMKITEDTSFILYRLIHEQCIVFLCSIKRMWRVRYQCKKLSVACYPFFFIQLLHCYGAKCFHLVFMNYYAPKNQKMREKKLFLLWSLIKKMNKTFTTQTQLYPPLSALKLPTT